MRSRRLKAFKAQYDVLPERIQKIARQKYVLFVTDPQHPSLRFKSVQSTRHLPHLRHEDLETLDFMEDLGKKLGGWYHRLV